MLTASWIPFIFLLCQIEQVSSKDQTKLVGAPEDALSIPTATVQDGMHLYSSLSKGSVPALIGQTSRPRKTLDQSAGRLNIRQGPTCGTGSVLACPLTVEMPCCPADYPVCCVRSNTCCAMDYYCAGTAGNPACCLNGSVACSNGNCCPSGTTCCGTTCCPSGNACIQGMCVDSQLAVTPTALDISSVWNSPTNSITSVTLTELVTPTHSNDLITINIEPSSNLIKYEPPNAWFEASIGELSNSSIVGVCADGTKVTQTAGASFIFSFQGTSISLSLIGDGNPDVEIDGKVKKYGPLVPDRCALSEVHTIGGLAQGEHRVIVTNDVASSDSIERTLGLRGISYTSKGVLGTVQSSSGSSPEIIGGSVGAVIGTILIVSVVFFVYWKRRQASLMGEMMGKPMQPIQDL